MKEFRKYRGYSICLRRTKRQAPYLIPALQRVAFSFEDAAQIIDNQITINEPIEREYPCSEDKVPCD
jgi:hypothetical protein